MRLINAEIIEEIMSHFGRTGKKLRPRIRKFHAELLYTKYQRRERVLSGEELARPKEYVNRMIRYSQGFLEYINEEKIEIKLTDSFFEAIEVWVNQYKEVEELDHSDENLTTQGIILDKDTIKFDGKLVYSRFYKLISDEGEAMNDPSTWEFNDVGIKNLSQIDFNDKNSHIFSSKLVNLKLYIMKKIDEVAFVTSRFVHCPACGANYVIPAAKTEFQATYKCENRVGEKQCKTTLKKFPARKVIPTHIYEVAIEVVNNTGTEFREFFLESFIELQPGYYTCQVFGRTEAKTNSFYFACLTAKEEKSKVEFELLKSDKNEHRFFDVIDSIQNHIKKVGFVIDNEKAKLPMIVETMKKLNLTMNKEINLDHSLYFGAPGIGKSYSLTLLHHMFYSNGGYISGPRFTLPGLTGGQKEVFYQDTAKKKNVPGLFSNQAFVFDEINNAQFLSDDKAINLFKSVALAPSGTSTTVGGKEFPRVSLIAGTANYDVNYLRHYENKVRKIYRAEKTDDNKVLEQASFISQLTEQGDDVPANFDFYAKLQNYDMSVKKGLKIAILKVRDEAKNYLTNFPKPLMERFYWSVLVHPKYDKAYTKQKQIDVRSFLVSRKSVYSQRELISQLFVPNFDAIIKEVVADTEKRFLEAKVENEWSSQVRTFLTLLSGKYIEFFSMFHRINQVHVFTLYSLSLLNSETSLSFATKRIFERLVSLMHTPIQMRDFHNPDFDKFIYVGETKGELLEIIKRYSERDIREYVDFEGRPIIRKHLVSLENNKKIVRVDEFKYKINIDVQFEKVETDKQL